MVCDQKAANVWTARVIPAILLGIIAYASWVVTQRLCVEYLIHPRDGAVAPRVGPAIAILTIYYTLLFPVLVCYARLITTIVTNPGFVPYGPQWYEQNKSLPPSHPARRDIRGYRRGNAMQSEKQPYDDSSSLSTNAKLEAALGKSDNDGLEFWQRDTFVCNYDGRPAWCNVCMNFKPDRAHHCREVNRCVLKMDHFCPWVGGIVGETSIKYFMQFVAYTTLYTLHTLISMAFFVAEERRETHGVDVHKAVAVALAGLFLLFSFGMTASTVQMAMMNLTTVENLNKKTKIWHLAVLIPRGELGLTSRRSPKFYTITYPRPPEETQLIQQYGGHPPPEASSQVLQTQPPAPASEQRVEPRVFAILSTSPGQNPFDLGPLRNLKEVLGYDYMDWILPLKASPCANHACDVSTYKMGSVVRSLQIKAGLLPPPRNYRTLLSGSPASEPNEAGSETRRHHKHHRRHTHRSKQHKKSLAYPPPAFTVDRHYTSPPV